MENHGSSVARSRTFAQGGVNPIGTRDSLGYPGQDVAGHANQFSEMGFDGCWSRSANNKNVAPGDDFRVTDTENWASWTGEVQDGTLKAAILPG